MGCAGEEEQEGASELTKGRVFRRGFDEEGLRWDQHERSLAEDGPRIGREDVG